MVLLIILINLLNINITLLQNCIRYFAPIPSKMCRYIIMTQETNDHRTYRDLIQNRFPPYVQQMGWTGRLSEFLSLGVRLPIIGTLLQESFSLVCIALNRFRRRGDYAGLYNLLVHTLLGTSFRKSQTYRWWYLMRFGVAVAQERQINWLIRDLILEDNLIIIGSLGPRPWKGYDVAYTFVGYSLWLFERGDIQGSINMVQIAVQADDTWGYPEYLHGWYGLFTQGVNSVEHFTRAVQIDWSFLQRMKQDRTCRRYPEMLKEVQRRTLVSK